jgi:hypothetical protein
MKEVEIDFREVDRSYVDLKRRYEAGDLSAGQFDERLKEMMVKDDQERWWAKSRERGDWYYFDGDDWKQANPPYKNGPTATRTAQPTTGSGSGEQPVHQREQRESEAMVVTQQARGWWVPVGIIAAVLGIFIPLLPLVGVYLGFRARQGGNPTGGNATMAISVGCLILWFLLFPSTG